MARNGALSIDDRVRIAITSTLSPMRQIVTGWEWRFDHLDRTKAAILVTLTRYGAEGDGGPVDIYEALKKSLKENGLRNRLDLNCRTILVEHSMVSADTFPALKRELERKRREKA